MRNQTDPVAASAREAAIRCAHFNLRKASRAVSRAYDSALDSTGLTGIQFSLLNCIAVTGPMTATDLAAALAMGRSTLMRHVKPLIERGYVTQLAEGEGRRRALVLTEAGRQAHGAALPLWRTTQRRIEASLGGKGLDRILSDLAALCAAARPR
ncbi:MAG TPA: MarR family winged helix-turn-helix transcriptional regulator [Kiloniellales bacterium]|nr:MarR family winged helix-turn-helix transcriptional regulator [Kiloniellales bacterium]